MLTLAEMKMLNVYVDRFGKMSSKHEAEQYSREVSPIGFAREQFLRDKRDFEHYAERVTPCCTSNKRQMAL